MKQLRWLVILLVLCLTVLMNIERLDFGGTDLINLSTFVYALGSGGIVAVLVLQPRLQWPPYILAAIMVLVYCILKLFVFNDHPILGGIATYVTVTEVTLLTVVVMLGARLSNVLSDFESVVHQLIFPEIGSRVTKLDEATERITLELNKSRRHNRPLGIIVVKPSVESIQDWFNHLVNEVKLALTTRYLLNLLATKMVAITRRSDFLIEDTARRRFIIVCPETDAKELPELRERIKAINDAKLAGVNIECGIASFPNGALTFEELLKEAERQSENSQNTTDVSEFEAEIKVPHDHQRSTTRKKRSSEFG
jgi:GGDEF domain-containing protein